MWIAEVLFYAWKLVIIITHYVLRWKTILSHLLPFRVNWAGHTNLKNWQAYRKKNKKLLTFPSTSRCLIHSFSLLVSKETESMHRWRQKFRAPNQSSSTPCNAGSRHEKKYLDDKKKIILKNSVRFHMTKMLYYPFPSGARSWITLCWQSCGTGGSKILPFGNCAAAMLSTEHIQTIPTIDFIFFNSAGNNIFI